MPCCFLHRRAAAHPRPEGETALLLRIKRAWGDPPALAAWSVAAASSAGAHCRWPYVRCDSAGRVTELALTNANISGAFQWQHTGDPVQALEASVPQAPRVGEAELLLQIKHAWGDPPVLAAWSAAAASLVMIGISITGPVPDAQPPNWTPLQPCTPRHPGVPIHMLRNLRYLVLDSNRLTGAIPAELGELTNLETLWLANNPFHAGELPASFKNLTNLTKLWAANCSLTGDFPSYLVKMPKLEQLYLDDNSLTGTIPPGIWGLKKLQRLFVRRNNLTGDLVIDGFAAMSLAAIDLSENNLTGRIPEVFGHLENLTHLSLLGNNFTGKIPVSISHLPSLNTLLLSTNKLTGMLPPELGKHSSSLNVIMVDENDLTGPIPEGLCARGPLWFLSASRNHFNGSIPASLAKCDTLVDLNLGSNQLSGKVPEALWTAGQIQWVILDNNHLTGSLPATLPSSLVWLYIENNQFVGRIPSVAVALEHFIAENNMFSGEFPANLAYGMPLLQQLNLANNKLSGKIH
ncbi:unnamed protein product [Urochloa decumbens]|uniref:Leucine-rich repeat-containing N-terminal plant-type domain-containing protein n=1 Tax=Urochloa decumbens TaxID=240449 RepID=A0ABC9BUD7_9POAL